MKKKIVLASTSRYRAELLRRLQFPFAVSQPRVEEAALQQELPAETALRLSLEKATSVMGQYPGALIIGSDQVAELDGMPIGKPGTREAARRQLNAMRGRSMIFHSGVALIDADTGHSQSIVIPTTVVFREFSIVEIERYLDLEDALDCAGSAKSEGLGIALIASMQSDDPTALVGLPLIALCGMLRQEGFNVLE